MRPSERFRPHEPHPDDPYFKRWLAEHGADVWAGLSTLPEGDPEKALEILRDLAACACTATHMGNINLGRWGVCTMPRAWVIGSLPPVLDAIIAAGDDWDFRRALELVTLLEADAELARLLEIGRRSSNPEVLEAVADWSQD